MTTIQENQESAQEQQRMLLALGAIKEHADRLSQQNLKATTEVQPQKATVEQLSDTRKEPIR